MGDEVYDLYEATGLQRWGTGEPMEEGPWEMTHTACIRKDMNSQGLWRETEALLGQAQWEKGLLLILAERLRDGWWEMRLHIQGGSKKAPARKMHEQKTYAPSPRATAVRCKRSGPASLSSPFSVVHAQRASLRGMKHTQRE